MRLLGGAVGVGCASVGNHAGGSVVVDSGVVADLGSGVVVDLGSGAVDSLLAVDVSGSGQVCSERHSECVGDSKRSAILGRKLSDFCKSCE